MLHYATVAGVRSHMPPCMLLFVFANSFSVFFFVIPHSGRPSGYFVRGYTPMLHESYSLNIIFSGS